ncbi:uncharacterized protein LOC123263614 [Cotesia glomerata]|uniref:Uncharacterized protein n=1 Tax=Cotesia glomerata TaxID=32391 RepID=A0AAV7I7M3_COTGL|nr:uncharacterized protein LOC123263614 [Cotesia glomerata]KAH0554672.1 hypothetical protein KQX54_012207 [Cotesia glomerata]
MRVLIVLIFCAITAAVPSCPNIRVIVDLNLASGTWYEFQRSDNNLILNGTCTTVIFHRNDECICRMSYYDIPMSEKTLLAEIVPRRSDVFYYRFPLIDIYDQEYYIIDTNYIEYTVLMSCDQNYGIPKFVVVTRNPNPSYKTVQKIRQAFHKRRINTPNLVTINNEDCGKF